jgi:hypothetical protein
LERLLLDHAPLLVRHLSTSPNDPMWNDNIPKVVDAWNWARAESWLATVNDEERVARGEQRVHELIQSKGRLLAELSAWKAWLWFFSRSTDTDLAYLKAWQKAVAKMGKGTSKYIARYQRDAQELLDKCRSVVPAWVMPLFRVYDTVNPTPGMFDVVIVDEASQCGPDALLLLYLAKKIIVVGDDKQISPDAVGIPQADVHQLMARHLGEIPLQQMFGTETSLFAHADMRIGKGQVVLREHFRCVPEIIRFNNDQFYTTHPLIPLRQAPPDRLRPIVCMHCDDGYVEGGSTQRINRREAQGIVEAIATCCSDPHYEDKTFGVISLLGEHQAKLIPDYSRNPAVFLMRSPVPPRK